MGVGIGLEIVKAQDSKLLLNSKDESGTERDGGKKIPTKRRERRECLSRRQSRFRTTTLSNSSILQISRNLVYPLLSKLKDGNNFSKANLTSLKTRNFAEL